MNCEDVQGLLDAYVDGELGAQDRAIAGRHIEGCETCARAVARTNALGRRLRELGRYPVPDGLQARITAIADDAAPSRWSASRPPSSERRLSMPALAISHVIAATIGAAAVFAWLQTSAPDASSGDRRDIVSAHVRGLVQSQFQAVDSGSPHTVRPWFSGKIGFAPRVVDLAEAGFALQGGRVEHLLGRPAAALTYARRNHRITVFIAPRSGHDASTAVTAGGEDGYHLVGWRDGEFAYWAVSDLNRAELATFTELLRYAIGGAGSRPAQ